MNGEILHDQDIRESLFFFLESTYGKIRILEEKNTGASRADAVMVLESCVCGIEIKSDADTYARLASQIESYDQYYDANFVVIGLSHLQHIREHIPAWWGIITCEREQGYLDFYIEQQAQPNPRMDPRRKLSLLWRPELNHILERNHLPAYREKSKAFVQSVLLDRVDRDLLWRMVSDELFERDYTRIADTIRTYREQHVRKSRRRSTKYGSPRRKLL